MLELNWSDVISTLTQIRGYLIAIGIIVAVAIVVMIACLKLAAHKKYVIRTQAVVAMVVGIAIVVIEKAVKAGKVKSIGLSKLDKGTRYYVSSEETLQGYHAFAPDFDGQE